MKRFAIIQDGKVSHIFNPMKEFGIDTNPYPPSINVVDISNKAAFIGDEYPLKIDKSLINSNPAQMLVVLVSMTNKCNLNCCYCYNRYRSKTDELRSSDLKEIVHSIKNISQFHIQGGECTLYFDEILDFAIEYAPLFPDGVVIRTNGTIEIDYSKIPKDIYHKLTFIYSLDGFKEYNDSRRGNGTFDKVIKSVKAAKEVGLYKLEMAATLSISDILNDQGEIQKFVHFLENLGVSKITIHIETSEFDDTLARELAYVKLLGLTFKCKSLINPLIACPKNVDSIHINTRGELSMRCPFVQHTFGHYLEFSFEKYQAIIKKADELKINCKTSDFTKINKFIENLGYEVSK